MCVHAPSKLTCVCCMCACTCASVQVCVVCSSVCVCVCMCVYWCVRLANVFVPVCVCVCVYCLTGLLRADGQRARRSSSPPGWWAIRVLWAIARTHTHSGRGNVKRTRGGVARCGRGGGLFVSQRRDTTENFGNSCVLSFFQSHCDAINFLVTSF